MVIPAQMMSCRALLLMLSLPRIVGGLVSCSEDELYVPLYARVGYLTSLLAVFECESGYESNGDPYGLMWCDPRTGTWKGRTFYCLSITVRCSEGSITMPVHTVVGHIAEGQYVVFECLPGWLHVGTGHRIHWCDETTGRWVGEPYHCEEQADKCNPTPCQNGGRCYDSEDPYGWGFYCWCPHNYGGRKCQFANPCERWPCPVGTVHCIRTYTEDKARYCYSSQWRVMD